ncbi:hypothetical protein AB3Y40_16630 [Yoonia sp. R2331]|uniref:hypothetical protein n=1 Tax=Yoonia sp. R2331 TaxID=3237238 RepID=UPI0034E3E73D
MRLAIVILCLLPTVLWAETATIRTGWHPTFTRIVIAIPQGADWQVGRTDAGFGFQAEGVTDFETNGFFARLPLDRIAQVDVEEARLNLALSCDCHADAFLWRPDRVVVDIRDGVAAADNPFEVALTREPTEPEQTASAIELDLLPRPRPPVAINDVLPVVTEEPAAPDLSEIEARIIDGLTRAADQGLLTLSPGALPSQPAEVVADEGATQEKQLPTPQPVETILSQLPARSGVRARTSVDVGLELGALEQPAVVAPTACWPDSHVQVTNWAEGDKFSEEIGKLRSRIYGEFDRVDHDAVTALARSYLYFGFGREATQTLQIDSDNTAERVAIVALAHIIDGELEQATGLAEQISCSGEVALWAFLATPVGAIEELADADRLVRQFKTLPVYLRVHLSPALAARLVAVGRVDAAENLLSIGAAQQSISVESAVVVADIALERGDFEDAEETLSTLAANNRDVTPTALLDLIALQLNRGFPVDPAVMSLLETKRFEYRGDPIDADLAAIQIKAEVASGRHGAALDILRASLDLEEKFPRSELNALIARDVTEKAKDMPFLEYAFAAEAADLNSETSNGLSERLLALGFADRAIELLSSSASGDAMAERRYLRAMAAMQLGDRDTAEVHLAGMTSARALAILNGSGSSDGQSPESVETAWRTNNWSSLATSEDPLLQSASELALRQTSSTPDPNQPLAQGRALIEQAAATQNTVSALLNRFDAPQIDAN